MGTTYHRVFNANIVPLTEGLDLVMASKAQKARLNGQTQAHIFAGIRPHNIGNGTAGTIARMPCSGGRIALGKAALLNFTPAMEVFVVLWALFTRRSIHGFI